LTDHSARDSATISGVHFTHGGFPLSEWQKYLDNPDQPLLFRSQDYTRKMRYLTDEEKRTGTSS